MPNCSLFPSASFARNVALGSTMVGLLLGSASAWAQAHEAHGDGYTLRSSTVRSTAVSAETAREHGIEPARNRAILNVVVMQRGAPIGSNNVPAEVQATKRSLTGVERPIDMRAAKAANGQVSYIGAYDFASREVLDFRISARPQGSQQPLELTYTERMPAITD